MTDQIRRVEEIRKRGVQAERTLVELANPENYRGSHYSQLFNDLIDYRETKLKVLEKMLTRGMEDEIFFRFARKPVRALKVYANLFRHFPEFREAETTTREGYLQDKDYSACTYVEISKTLLRIETPDE